MSNDNLSLEDLIYLVDSEAADTDSVPSKDDPFGDDTLDDDTPDDDTLEEEEQTLEEETPSEETPSEETLEEIDETPAETDDEPDAANVYSSYYELLQENGLVFTDEEFEFDGSAEALATAIEQTKKNLNSAVAAALYEKLPEEFKPVLTYALNGGQNINEFLSVVASASDIDTLDVNTPAGQKAILARYYAETTPFDEAKIQKLVQKSELAETLEDDAQEALETLQELKTKKANELIEQQEQAQVESERVAEEQRKQIQSLIDEAEFIKTNRKGKVKAFIFNALTNSQGQQDTQFRSTIAQIASNPEHLVQLADLLLDYDPKTGISLERFKSAAQSSATKSLKEKLEEAASAKSKVSGKGGRRKADDFD